MSSPRYLVWIKDAESRNRWEECGEGPMTQKQADRIAREIRQDCRVPARAHIAGFDPNPV